jgi:hypothetical protein
VNRLCGLAPNWLANMENGTSSRTLNLTGNLITGYYKAIDNLATGFIPATNTWTSSRRQYRKVDHQLDLGACEPTPPVRAELVLQSKVSAIGCLEKPSTQQPAVTSRSC